MKIDFSAVKAEFEGLQGRHPGLWPKLPRFVLLSGLFVLLCALAYGFYWRGLLEEAEVGVAREEALRKEFVEKMRKAVNLAELRRQKEQVQSFVSVLEKQLPSKAEMDALLSDINQAGVGRGLQFELFRPGSVVVQNYYAELPISIRLVGGYHELGHFTSDVANLPRIVTLNDLSLSQDPKNGQLVLEATAKTYRYLDADEIAAQAAAQKAIKDGRKR